MDSNQKANLLSSVITGLLNVDKVLANFEEKLNNMIPTDEKLEKDLEDIISKVDKKENASAQETSEEVYCIKFISANPEEAMLALAEEMAKMDNDGWICSTISSHWECDPEVEDKQWHFVSYVTYS